MAASSTLTKSCTMLQFLLQMFSAWQEILPIGAANVTQRRESRVLKQTTIVRLSWSALLRAAWAGAHILCDIPPPPPSSRLLCWIPLPVSVFSLVSSLLWPPLHSSFTCNLSLCYLYHSFLFLFFLKPFFGCCCKKTWVRVFQLGSSYVCVFAHFTPCYLIVNECTRAVCD